METVRGVIVKRASFLAALLVAMATVAVVDVSVTSAVSAKFGVITGRVDECGPGPIIITPSTLVPTAKPVLVRVLHDERTFASEEVRFTSKMPWTGTFRFSVPAGTYEVVSSYRNVGRWVNVRPGSHNVVSFGVIACPMMTVPSKPT
jgi:hypothetical protein